MLNGFTPRAITIYWLSEFADRFETWVAKGASIVSGPEGLHFKAFLVWPVAEADEARISLSPNDAGWVLKTDWFPEEEFALKLFASPQGDETILMSTYERETIFLHLRA